MKITVLEVKKVVKANAEITQDSYKKIIPVTVVLDKEGNIDYAEISGVKVNREEIEILAELIRSSDKL